MPPSSPTLSRSNAPSSPFVSPGAKVRALLAQFDSDSEGGNDEVGKTHKDPEPIRSPAQAGTLESGFDSDGDSDGLPVRPRGRMAARMQESDVTPPEVADDDDDVPGAAYERIRKQLLVRNAETEDKEGESEGEDGNPVVPRRRLYKRKSSPVPTQMAEDNRSRSGSPMFFPSPSPSKRVRRSTAEPQDAEFSESETESEDGLSKKPNPRLMALVEKQRQKRLEKEAVEAEKKAARLEALQAMEHRPRGSSPADASEEDSGSDDGHAGQRLTQHARPTRKASKKALEEMNRETQRISRNMQLAHQAQTKKKITKESFLARFNFTVPRAPLDQPSSTTASSAPNSDAEADKAHTTPPTSPLRQPETEKVTEIIDPPGQMPVEVTTVNRVGTRDEDLPTLEEILTQPQEWSEKGKGKAIKVESEDAPASRHNSERKSSKTFQIRLSVDEIKLNNNMLSDDELEVTTTQPEMRELAVFQRLPKRKAREAPSHLILRSLAHLTSPGRKGNGKKAGITVAQMEAELRRQARLQAAKERAEKIAELKARGVFIQTAEEREKEQQEVEDLVEKARQEAAEIQRREERKAKKDGTFEDDGLDDDDEYIGEYDGDEDEQFSGSDDDDDGENESEEDAESDDELTEGKGESAKLIDGEASEVDSEEEEQADQDHVEDLLESSENELVNVTPLKRERTRRTQRALIDSDDEMESPDMEQQATPIQQQLLETPRLPANRISSSDEAKGMSSRSTVTPQSIVRSARKVIPGLPQSDDMPIGLTQAFAATMADNQSQDSPTAQEQDSLTMMRDLPEPDFAIPTLQRLESIDIVSDSQPASQTQPLGLNLSFSQSQDQSQLIAQSPIGVASTQLSEFPEPTQDAGYILSPFEDRRFDTPAEPHSTIDTVILPAEESPVLQRRGRLTRRVGAIRTAGSDEEGSVLGLPEPSVFDKMRQAANRRAREEVFNKTESKAKEHVDEAAEESEDEYAGLGGASDDEEGQANEEDQKMIDDENNEKVDERELAALHADKERAEDSAAVSKLLQDITSGRLRRKRGAGGFDDLDLSDEESAYARRREAKRREFAKIRRELLVNSDERIGKIANDPKKHAFLNAIEDREEGDDIELDLNYHEETEASSQSQQQTLAAVGDDTKAIVQQSSEAGEATKQPLQPARPADLNRAPGNRDPRRKSGASHRPQTLAEIRESVSFLIEEPVDINASHASDSESDPEGHENLDQNEAEALMEALDHEDKEADEDDDMDDFIVEDEPQEEPLGERSIFKKPGTPASHHRAPFSQRRTKHQPRGPVVDRLSLLRHQSSSSSSSSTTTNISANPNPTTHKLAFFSTTSSPATFKPPSLLRRATTNSSNSSSSSSFSTVPISATGVTTTTERDASDARKNSAIAGGGGGKKSSVVGFYKNSRAQQREEDMRRRLEGGKGGKKVGDKGKSGVKGMVKRRGGLGILVSGKGSWD